MQASNPEGRLNRTFLAFLTFAKTSIKNPLFEVILLHGQTGPPVIRVLISVLFTYYKYEKQEREE